MNVTDDAKPRFFDVLTAAARIAAHARLTPVATSRSLDALSRARLHFKCEQLQRVGAFKFRGACNAVLALAAEAAPRGVVTHSSGNHGAALALASKIRGIPCHVVVPEGAVRSKLEAIEASGAVVHHCTSNQHAREAACARVQAITGATLVHPYTSAAVIAGQGTAALELLTAHPDLDALVVPIGGGGLAAGTVLAMQALAPSCQLYLAEPAGADDAARSFALGALEHNVPPDTICDGLRANIGAINFEILRNSNARVLTVDDAQTIAAMRLLWSRAKQLVEPSSATVLAVVLANPALFEDRKVGIVLSGGNVDLDALPQLFALGG
jgi:threonine dehydratase